MKLFKSVNDRRRARNAAGDSESRTQREHRALLAARALVDRMRTMYRELEQMTGAPIAVHRALANIGANPGIQASKLATALGMQRPAMSHVLKHLVEKKWIERVRDDHDQRSVRLFVTSDGRKLLQATSGRAVGTLQRAVSRLADEEIDGLAVGLEQLLAHLPDNTPADRQRQP